MSGLLPRPPAGGEGRTLSLLTFVQSVGYGSFAACGALFFIRSVGLSVREVGAGTALAGLAALVAALLAGRLADRVGARGLLVFLGAAQAVLFASYTAVHTFGSFLVVICALTAGDQAAWVARNTVIAGLTAGPGRVRLKAYLRSVAKLGVALGTGVAAVPLHFDTRAAYLAVVFANAAAAAASAVLAARLPRRTAPAPARPSATAGWVALRDRPYMRVAILCGLLATYHSLLTIALPLWVAGHTRAPHAMVAGLFVINTVLSIGLQMTASRRAGTVTAARRTALLGARLVAPACALFAIAATVPATSAMVLLVAGAVVLTVGELWTSAAAWSLSFELADSRAPGQYQGAFAVGMSIDSVAGPLLATGLVLGLGIAGWFAAGALFVLLGTAVAKATEQAQRSRRAPAGLEPTLRLVVDPTLRFATADPALRLAYPEAATDLLTVPVPGLTVPGASSRPRAAAASSPAGAW